MYEKNGEKYFIVDGHMHFWDARPENRQQSTAKGFIACFYDYHRNLVPEEYVWPKEKYDKYSEEDIDPGPLRGRLRRQGDLPADVPDGLLPGGFNTTEQDAEMLRSTRASSSSTAPSTRATASRASKSSTS